MRRGHNLKLRGKAKLALLLCVIMMVSLVAGCAGGNKNTKSADEDVIKLGFLGATTGSVANYGIPGQKGMKMAIDELNANGGILGKKVEGVYKITKATPVK
jgi:branched-chain amino acid transport system substrate-binding protein